MKKQKLIAVVALLANWYAILPALADAPARTITPQSPTSTGTLGICDSVSEQTKLMACLMELSQNNAMQAAAIKFPIQDADKNTNELKKSLGIKAIKAVKAIEEIEEIKK